MKVVLKITLGSLQLFCFLSLSSSSQMAPPSWTVSQGLAQEEEEVAEEQQGSTPKIRGPRNGSTSPTSPSASETLTYGKCLGCVDKSRIAATVEKKDAGGEEKKT